MKAPNPTPAAVLREHREVWATYIKQEGLSVVARARTEARLAQIDEIATSLGIELH